MARPSKRPPSRDTPRLSKRPPSRDTPRLSKRPPSRDDERRFLRFSELVTRELGIRMPHQKRVMMEGRIQRRLRALNLETLEQYEHYLFESPGRSQEMVHFLDAMTTNKTDFFREPRQFDVLCRTALPALEREMVGGNALQARIWCAGCSSGQEPYTLAMVLSEYAASRSKFGFSVLGTDVCTTVLSEAAKAVYPETAIDPIPLELRKKYLLRSKDQKHATVRIAPELRRKVRFGQLNFMAKDYGIREKFHAIFFRNVMIYFDKPTQEAVLSQLCQRLEPGGYLFIGLSESLSSTNLPLTPVTTAVFRKKA